MLKTEFVYEYPSSGFVGFSVVIEQNRQVTYAYLLKDKNIISDVWLYNVSTTPSTANWSSEADLSFKNPLPFLKNSKSPIPASNIHDFNVVWTKTNDLVHAVIHLRKEVLAKLSSNEVIGYSAQVKMDGPLAKVL